MPPIIGLTTYGYREKHNSTTYYNHHYAVPKDYVDAVTRAGGIPLLLPSNNNDWETLWSVLDGVLVTGGTDVAPYFYKGDEQNPNVHADDPERDVTEIKLIKHALTMKDKPILCVCRGIQVLNVALGGTLHAHLADICDEDIHRNNATDIWTTHDCLVEPDSRLARMMRAETVHTYSGHHQAIDKVAEGLQVVATAPDGIVEAVTMTEHPWLLGVQWHPEKSAATDPTQQRLFHALVKAADRALL